MVQTSVPVSDEPDVAARPADLRPGLATLAAVSVLAGFWPVTGWILTFAPALLVPSALGLPFALPALRPFPLGATTTASWLVDLVAAFVMLAVTGMRLVDSSSRHPHGGPGRAFLAGWGATVLGVLAGNLIRIVYLSFVVHAGSGAYLLSLAGGALVSLLWGGVAGLAVGAAQTISSVVRSRRSLHRDDANVVGVGPRMDEPQ
ncbi:hypothetical protein [Rhodococcus sp. NPDC127528]|uniref:hypothetical protein n=1 Tax=unclassified Rhodococcus (in: high G+C Gram-positive bacteria) TaxID=192944 RepID=UPI00362D120A